MRTKILNLVLPMAVIAVGLAGALKTNAMEKSESKLVPVAGYKHVSAPQNCEEVQMCDNTGDFICTSDIDESTLYALTPDNPGSCPEVLKRSVE
jgi:hypothetical protein